MATSILTSSYINIRKISGNPRLLFIITSQYYNFTLHNKHIQKTKENASFTLHRSSRYRTCWPIFLSGDNVVAGSGGDLKLVLNSDTTLVDSVSQKYLSINDDKSLSLQDNAQSGYSFKDGYLAHDDSSAFSVCSEGLIKFDSTEDGCTGVAVSVRNEQEIDDVQKSEDSEPAESGDDITKFGLIATHSGSSVQNSAIKKVPEHPHVFSVGGNEGEDLVLTLDTDSQTLADQDNRGIYLDENTGELGDVAPFGRQPATSGFTVEDGHLAYNGNPDWKACPSGGNKYSLSNKDCTGGISIELHVVEV